MCSCLAENPSPTSRISGPTSVADLTMPLFSHPYVNVLSTNGSIKATKICTCMTYSASSRYLMVRSSMRFLSVRNIQAVTFTTGSLHTYHLLLGIWNTPPIPSRDAFVYLLQVGRCKKISPRCVGHYDSELIRWRHGFSLSRICAEIRMRLPDSVQSSSCYGSWKTLTPPLLWLGMLYLALTGGGTIYFWRCRQPLGDWLPALGYKMTIALEANPPKVVRISKNKWFRLQLILSSAFPAIAGAVVMFSRTHNRMKNVLNQEGAS